MRPINAAGLAPMLAKLLAPLLAILLAVPVLAQTSETPPKAVTPKPSQAPTPNSERAVELVALDKLSGNSQILTLKPGQSLTFRELTITVRTCETRAPGLPPESGAFVQISNKDKRLFSGWMFAVARSLNAFEHPAYGVWVKSCKMRFPDSGPDTVTVRGGAPAPRESPAKPSKAPDVAPAEPSPSDEQ